MNKQQALERLEAIEKEAAELRAIIDKPEPKVWEPEEDEYFFDIYANYVTNEGLVSNCLEISTGLASRTHEQRDQLVKWLQARHRLIKRIHELSGDDPRHYYFAWGINAGISYSYRNDLITGDPLLRGTNKAIETVIKEMSDDIETYFKGYDVD